MRQHDDRRARRQRLRRPSPAIPAARRRAGQAGRFEAGIEVEHVDQPDEMHAAGIEAVPAAPLGLLAVAREIGLAVVDIGDVVLAGDVEDLLVGALDHLVGGVPLRLFRQVADIAGMDQEGRLRRQSP